MQISALLARILLYLMNFPLNEFYLCFIISFSPFITIKFDFHSLPNIEIRMYGTPQKPLFLAKDVTEWIEHSNSSVMISKVDEDEKNLMLNNVYNQVFTNNLCSSWYLTEEGLYETFVQSTFFAKDSVEWIDYSFSNKNKGSRRVSQMLSTVDEDVKVLGVTNVVTQNKQGGLRENT